MAARTLIGISGFVGDLAEYRRDPLTWLQRAQQTGADGTRLARGIIAVFEPDTVHRVLTETNTNFIIDSGGIAGARGRTARLARLPAWMTVRRELWRGFRADIVDAHIARSPRWLPADPSSLGTGLVEACRDLCGRGIADFCLGGDTRTQKLIDDIHTAAADLFASSYSAIDRAEARVRWLPRPAAAAADAANRRLVELLAECIELRVGAPPPTAPRDLLDVLLHDAEPRSKEQVLAVLRMSMFAAPGVPGIALTWLLLHLADHPEIRARVTDELGRSRLTAAGLPTEATYTIAVIRESLRLHPPQWVLSRTAVRTTELAGYRVKPGHEVIMCPYLLHRDNRYWTEPEHFDPGRWSGGALAHRRHAYIPFGSGTRICPGSHLGIVEMVLAARHITAAGNLHLPQLTQVTPQFATLLQPGDMPAPSRPRPRPRPAETPPLRP
ncbi:cytochrome P450 [Nocardia barduliensis]|uniref:cytochrome P450 n=1 Tax=Nocardia barduliensis TaxID=2736643 RepID=UPI00157178D4|nr:cytochrome P450 [Nocardia barduliensis]